MLAAMAMLAGDSSATEGEGRDLQSPSPSPVKRKKTAAKGRGQPTSTPGGSKGRANGGVADSVSHRGSAVASPSASSRNGVPVSDFEGRLLAANADAPKPGQKTGGKVAERRPWLHHPRDKNKNPPGHPDHDPTTLYIPAAAWPDLSPFEEQYVGVFPGRTHPEHTCTQSPTRDSYPCQLATPPTRQHATIVPI